MYHFRGIIEKNSDASRNDTMSATVNPDVFDRVRIYMYINKYEDRMLWLMVVGRVNEYAVFNLLLAGGA